MSEPQVLRFVHRFGHSLRCELCVEDRPPQPGEQHRLRCEWIGKPKCKHIPEYRRWILQTHQFLADRWQQRVLYALGVARNQTELWCFEPGGSPKLLEKLNIGIL
jgi:hypothetical protein